MLAKCYENRILNNSYEFDMFECQKAGDCNVLNILRHKSFQRVRLTLILIAEFVGYWLQILIEGYLF